MKKELNEIIDEINGLELNAIPFDDWDKENLSLEEIKEQAQDYKKNAINFIKYKYEQLNNSDYATDEDYEYAYLKTFQEKLGIIINQERLNELDKNMKNKMEDFFSNIGNTFYND